MLKLCPFLDQPRQRKTPAIKVGGTLTMDTDAILRANIPASKSADARIAAALQRGSNVRVEGIEYSPAPGGYCLWCKVRRLRG